MPRFVYTIIFFVIISGFGIWFILNNYNPSNLFIILVCFLFFIWLSLINSLFLYFFNLKQSKLVFASDYKSIYRKGLVTSVFISFFVTLLLSFQLLQVLDLITLVLLMLFSIFWGIFRSEKLRYTLRN